MKTRFTAYCLLAALLVGLAAPDAQAGDPKRRGTAGSDYLLVPLTAQTASLGGTMTGGVMSMTGLEALFANPAGLMQNAGTNASFSRMNYVADIGVNYLGVAQRFGNNNIAFTISAWDFGDIPTQTEQEADINDVTWNASYVTVGASYARQFTDRIAAGLTVKLLSERIDDVSAGGVAFDAGMSYVAGESGLRFGVSLKNFGPQMGYEGSGLVQLVRLPEQGGNATPNAVQIEGAAFELPSLLNFGIAYSKDIAAGAQVSVLGNFRSNSFDQDVFSGGLELGLRNLLFLRGAYEYRPDQDLNFYTGLNFGAGLNLDLAGTRFSVDYGFRQTNYFSNVQLVTASITL